jgi:outer membrane protein
MKVFLIGLNIILLAAVAFLFYKVFSNNVSTSTATTSVIKTGTGDNTTVGRIAYVELDSLYENIKYIRNMRESLESEQKGIEKEWTSGMQGLDAKKNNFISKNGNNMTQEMAEQFQNQLMQEQQNIENKKQNQASKLSDKSYRFMDEVQTKMKTFLNDYNTDKGYAYILTSGTGLDYMIYRDSTLNITNDVISGMNEMFNKKK